MFIHSLTLKEKYENINVYVYMHVGMKYVYVCDRYIYILTFDLDLGNNLDLQWP